MSPRFYGPSGQHPYFGKPEEVSRELLSTLQRGMNELRQKQDERRENLDPNVRYEQMMRGRQSNNTMAAELPQLILNQLPPYLTQMITNPNATADIMNMSMDELDNLKQQNEDRIRDIESKYFQKKDEIKKVKEVC